MIRIVPFPAEQLELLWAWLNQFPRWNFDDSAPKTLDEYRMEILARVERGEALLGVVWEVDGNEQLVGAIGWHRQTERTAALRGICFDRAVHGLGVAKEALRMILETAWEQGIERIEALYFADNVKVKHFLKRAGFEQEGFLRKRVPRGGKLIDQRVVAALRPAQKGGDECHSSESAPASVC